MQSFNSETSYFDALRAQLEIPCQILVSAMNPAYSPAEARQIVVLRMLLSLRGPCHSK